MRGWETLLASFLLVALGSCATPDRSVRSGIPSLIIGDWVDAINVRGVPCPEEYVCLNVIGDIRFARIRTLAGPPISSPAVVRLEYHSEPLPDRRPILLVRPTPKPSVLAGVWIGMVKAGKVPCVARSVLAEHGISPTSSYRNSGDLLCFARTRERV